MTAVSERAGAHVELDPRVLRLRSDGWELDVLPGTGASVAAGRVRLGDTWVDLLRPTPSQHLGSVEHCASFAMVPWSNRIRDGVLRYGGRTWQLQHNGADGTAIHGTTGWATWDVVERTEGAVTLAYDSTRLVGVNFPWRFAAEITYALSGNRLSVTTSVRNLGAEPFPAGFGHHPYFRRTLVPPGTLPSVHGDPVLHVPAAKGFPLEAGMAVGPAGEIPARADYRRPRPVGRAFVDDVLTDLARDEPVRITYDEGLVVELRSNPVYAHVVVYVPRGRSFFAVEPVTNVNDGFTLHDAGVAGTGVVVLQPDEQVTGTFTVDTRG
ncbi:aldose epimerase family protein [Cellulomonas persica]